MAATFLQHFTGAGVAARGGCTRVAYKNQGKFAGPCR